MTDDPFLGAVDDIGQIIFVIVFLAVGFIQWLIKMMKDKAEAAERARRVPTREEAEARREVWQEQTRPITPSPTSTTPVGGGLGELLGEFRKAFEEAQRPAAPPPLPHAARPQRQRSHEEPAQQKTRVRPALAESSAPAVVIPHRPLAQKRSPHPLTALLHTPDGYRQAFVLREVLGPPRALREYAGPED